MEEKEVLESSVTEDKFGKVMRIIYSIVTLIILAGTFMGVVFKQEVIQLGTISIEIDFKEIILLYITIVGFISYVPQIIKLIKQKSATEHSILTQVFWSTNSALYLLYLYMSEVTSWLIVSQLIEVALICLTFLVILYYKFKAWLMNRTAKYESTSTESGGE